MNENLLPLEAAKPKVIKKNQASSASSAVSRNLVKHQILNAEEQGREILQQARAAGADIINRAETEAETIRREAYAEGREKAESETLENLLAVKEERFRVLSTIEQDVLKLAVKLAEKIIGREIQQDETTRGEIVLNALRAARQKEMLTVRVNANDLPLLEQMRERIDAFNRAQYIDFVADQAVVEGGCIIESASGTIDARLETQLRILENALLAQRMRDEG